MSGRKTNSNSILAALTRRDVLRGGVLIPAAIAVPGIFTSFAARAVTTFDYYISPTGSDSNPGTLGSPWAITALNTQQSVYSGKRVGLLDGTYNISSLMTTTRDTPALNINGGSAGSPTVIQAVNPRQATITAGGSTPYNIVNAMIGHTNSVSNQGNLTIDGFFVTGGRTNIIEIGLYAISSNVPNVLIQNCEITGNSDLNSNPGGSNAPGAGGGNASGITLNNCLNATVSNNFIHDNVGHSSGSADHLSGILVWLSRGTTIQYNTIIKSGYGVYGKESVNQGTICRNNYLSIGSLSADQGQIYDFAGAPTSGLSDTSYFYNNVIISYAGANLRDNLDTGGWSTNCLFYNNTIIGPISNCGFSFFSAPGVTGNLQFYNNLCYGNGANSTGYGWLCLSLGAASLIDFNLYSDTKFSAVPQGSYKTTSTSGYSTLASWQAAMAGSTGAESHSKVGAPTFTNVGVNAARYQMTGGLAFQTGKVGGVASGATCNIGAWDGTVTQIGCNFSTVQPDPPPSVNVA